jgi:hypothetical protein
MSRWNSRTKTRPAPAGRRPWLTGRRAPHCVWPMRSRSSGKTSEHWHFGKNSRKIQSEDNKSARRSCAAFVQPERVLKGGRSCVSSFSPVFSC